MTGDERAMRLSLKHQDSCVIKWNGSNAAEPVMLAADGQLESTGRQTADFRHDERTLARWAHDAFGDRSIIVVGSYYDDDRREWSSVAKRYNFAR